LQNHDDRARPVMLRSSATAAYGSKNYTATYLGLWGIGLLLPASRLCWLVFVLLNASRSLYGRHLYGGGRGLALWLRAYDQTLHQVEPAAAIRMASLHASRSSVGAPRC
jgi:hypothetical protein